MSRSLLPIAAVLIVVACSSAPPTPAPTPSQTPVAATPTTSASPSPTESQPSISPSPPPIIEPTASPSGTPIPSASVSAAPNTSGVFEWRRIVVGGGLPTWAPDSQHFYFDDGDLVQVFDAAANPVKSFNGLEPLWLNSHTVQAYDVDTFPPKGPAGQFYSLPGRSVDVTNGTLEQVSLPCCFPISNDHGAAAVIRKLPDSGLVRPTFVVWQAGHASAEHEGYPLGWDAAGDKLAVLHSPQPVDIDPFFDPRGWLEVLSWPDMKTLFAESHNEEGDAGDNAFDPTGTYFVYYLSSDDGSGIPALQIEIARLATGSVATIPLKGDPSKYDEGYVWSDLSQIQTFNGSDTALITYGPDGTKIAQRKVPPLTSFEASADGTTLLSIQLDADGYPTPVTAYRAGASALLQPPGQVHSYSISPDGRRILITVGSPAETVYLADVPL